MTPDRLKKAVTAAVRTQNVDYNIENVAVIWRLRRVPRGLPDGKYCGMIMKPSFNGYVVYSTDPADINWDWSDNKVTCMWINDDWQPIDYEALKQAAEAPRSLKAMAMPAYEDHYVFTVDQFLKKHKIGA